MSEKLANLIKQVNVVAQEVISTIQSLDARIVALGEQRKVIGDAPVSRHEFLAYIGKAIDQKTNGFGELKARELGKVDTSFFSMEKTSPSINFLVSSAGTPVAITEEACHWYLKPLILARMAELIEDFDFPDKSIPIEKRRVMIAEIDAEISKLRAERNTLASQLQSAGVVR